MSVSEGLITETQAAALIGISRHTLKTRRSRGEDTPPFVKLGHKIVRYREADVLAWISAHVVGDPIATAAERIAAELPELTAEQIDRLGRIFAGARLHGVA